MDILDIFGHFYLNHLSPLLGYFLDEGVIVWAFISLVLGGEVPRLDHGPICFAI